MKPIKSPQPSKALTQVSYFVGSKMRKHLSINILWLFVRHYKCSA